jgi:hypothetical protein
MAFIWNPVRTKDKSCQTATDATRGRLRMSRCVLPKEKGFTVHMRLLQGAHHDSASKEKV